MFQSFNLFPHLTVLDDVVVGPARAHSMGRSEAVSAARGLEGMTMLIATHEMGFARDVADEVCFMHEGPIRERGQLARVLSAPEQPETQRFLRRLLEAGRV